MIIDIDMGSDGFTQYVTNRDENSYAIIDGDIRIFEAAAQHLRDKGVEKPYYRTLLSFDEEDLTVDQITEIYYSFKEKFLKNYDEAEYQVFAVIHLDDVKPHIHMGIIANSILNDKRNRIMRGRMDIKRVDSIGEMLNYEFNLKSYRDSISIVKTTQAQKERNWKVKKGKPWYSVDDDNFYENLDRIVKKSNSFEEFKRTLQKKYPNSTFSKFPNSWGEFSFILDKNSTFIERRSFSSLLFNSKWFENNISILHSETLDTIKTKIDRGTYEDYKHIYETSTIKHAQDLIDRNIHEGLLEYKLKTEQIDLNLNPFIEKNDLDKIKNIVIQKRRDRDKFSKLLSKIGTSLRSIDELNILLNALGAEFVRSGQDEAKGGKYITVLKDDKKFIIPDEHLHEISKISYRDIEPLDYSLYEDSFKEDIKPQTFSEMMSILSPVKHKERNLIKQLILEETLNTEIETKVEFELLLESIGAKYIKHTIDVSKGGYVTIEFKNKNIAIYSNMLYGFYDSLNTNESFNTEVVIPENNTVSNSIEENIFDKDKPKSIKEFKVEKSFPLNYSFEDNYSMEHNINPLPVFLNTSKITDNISSLLLEKSTNLESSAQDLIDIISQKKEINPDQFRSIKLNGSKEFEKTVIMKLLELSKNNYYKWINETSFISDSKNEFRVKNGKLLQEEKPKINKDILDNIPREKIYRLIDLVREKKKREFALNMALKDVEELKYMGHYKKMRKNIESLLLNIAETKDAELLLKTIDNIGYTIHSKYKNNEGVKTTTFAPKDKENKFKHKIKSSLIFDLIDKKQNQEKEFRYKELQDQGFYKDQTIKSLIAKERFLKKLYSKSFEYTPVLNYNIQDINQELKDNKKISFRQNDSYIFQDDKSIKLYKSKNLYKSARDMVLIAQAQGMENIMVNGDDNFKKEVYRYIKGNNIKIKIVNYTDSDSREATYL